MRQSPRPPPVRTPLARSARLIKTRVAQGLMPSSSLSRERLNLEAPMLRKSWRKISRPKCHRCARVISQRPRGLLAGLLIGFASLELFCFAGVAECYDLAGHFDSVAAAIYGLDPAVSPDDANLVAFCAWLPDRTPELSAVGVYRAMLASPLAYACWSGSYGPLKTSLSSAPVANMVAVQQLLHGITGGDSVAEQAVAQTLQVSEELEGDPTL